MIKNDPDNYMTVGMAQAKRAEDRNAMPTEAMVNAFWSKVEVQRTGAIRGLEDGLRAALSAALAHPGQVREIAIKPLEKAAEALKPLADAVFNDNGDMTVSVPLINAEQCIKAYFAVKQIRSALALPLPVQEPHTDDLAVDRFAAAMKAKLAEKRAQGYHGWDDPQDCTIDHLSNLLIKHVEKGDPIDVGNFAMMIHQRGGRISL